MYRKRTTMVSKKYVQVIITWNEGVVNDLNQQSKLFPQHGEYLFGPRQKRHSPAAELLHFRPFTTTLLGTNHRGHFLSLFLSFSFFLVTKDKITYSDIPRRKPNDFAYSSVTGERCRWAVASFSGKSVPLFFGISFRQMCSCIVVSMFFIVLLSVVRSECLGCCNRTPLYRRSTSDSVLIGQNVCHSKKIPHPLRHTPPIYVT